ncbi:hypothetical protein HanRHA438_Chr09g0388271 [Helianthus annuus]|nr:hypothetical protein HanIR_Chr09g0406041 [Helianthus annuus]KAJ0541562.1 hypothetical protein HanHA89_Chr09g0329861 [Helianthus annuus]KAJ0706636.1 hypothetical protein HanLR1_Chr09g0309291 [Helianthus annuus]KAJ0887220.1 hypothetical protein HanRHA438_Chr09g0388271 [Helianthus annuus]
MERTEPTFVPEWLKNSGSLSTTSHQSSLHSDDQSGSISLRRKSLINSGDNESGRATSTTSAYFRRPSSSNGRLRSYGSFGRRDWDKSNEKYENRYRDSDPLSSILPIRFEKDGLRRAQSNLSTKRGEFWSRRVVGEKNGRNNGKISFEKDFPSLGSEEKQVGLSSAIQSLPVGTSGVIGGGDVWTSALAEVPVKGGPNGSASVSVTANVAAAGRNMAETLAQGPPRVQTAPQLSVGSQRLEELAVKQSRQLIPVTPSMPKALALNSSDKPKLKLGQLQSPHIANHPTPTRPVSMNADVTKSSTIGKLHVLKPSRERNGTTLAKEITSPTVGSKLPESSLVDRKPCVEKRPSPQAKSRNDFFNLMRKKAMANNSSSSVPVDPPESTNDKPSEGGVHPNDLSSDTDACVVTEKFNNNEKSHSSSDVILYSEEEEARFLRSMGWEETTEEDGLTEEEINSFYKDLSKYVNLKTASNFFKGTQLKSLMPLNLLMGKNGEFSADTKVDS